MKLTIDHHSPIPLYIQVEKLLREMIGEEEYQKGKKLPNEIDMSRQLGIARNTIRQAINTLVQEGVLIRKKGHGTTVVTNVVTSTAKNWLSFSQEMKALGLKVKDYELHTSFIPADEELANFFNIKIGAQVLKLERLRGNEERPFVYFISYFNPRIGLSGVEDFSRPLYQVLETDYSIMVKLSREEISAMLTDKFLEEKLKLHVGDPVLKRKRFVFDPGQHPVEYNLGYYRADSFKYTIECERE